MNQTKKITQGAMLIAIIGALIEVDKLMSFMFSTFILTMMPIVIIIYGAMYSSKDAAVFCVALAAVSFITSAGATLLTYAVYIPVGVIVGMSYSIALSKTKDRKKLLVVAMVSYLICEVLVYFVVSPILGTTIEMQIAGINELLETTYATLRTSGVDTTMFEAYFTVQLIKSLFVLAIIFMGIAEGLITNVLSTFLLKRFKIMDIEQGSLLSYKLNPVLAYIFMIFMFVPYLRLQVSNDTIQTAITLLPIIGQLVLAFFGYIYACIYFRVTGRPKRVALVMLGIFILPSIMVFVLAIVGFLYATGPLKRKLEEKGLKL